MFPSATKPAVLSVTMSPSGLKNNAKMDDGGKAEDTGLLCDQLVPDYAAGLVISLKPFLVSLNVYVVFDLTCDTFMHFFCCSFFFCQQDETKNVSDGRQQTIALPPDNCE